MNPWKTNWSAYTTAETQAYKCASCISNAEPLKVCSRKSR